MSNPTTRDQLEAAAIELGELLDEYEKSPNNKTTAAVQAKTNELTRLRAQHQKDQADRLSERPDITNMLMCGDAVAPGAVAPKNTVGIGTDAASLSFSQAGINELHAAASNRKMAVQNALSVTEVPQADIPAYTRESWPGLREMSRIMDLIPSFPTSGNAVNGFRANALADQAATVAPGAVKPESTPDWVEFQSPVRKIAHWVSVEDEVIADHAQFVDMIGTEMIAGLIHTENAQLLVGDGLGTNLNGLVPAATAAGATVPSAGTDLDAVVAAMTRIRTTAFVEPNVIIMHPNDWGSTGFALAKDSQGNYIVGDAVHSPQPMLWGLRVVLTTQMTENSALVANMARAARVWVRERPRLEAAPSSGDEFKNNTTLFRAEERIALEVVRPEALCVITDV